MLRKITLEDFIIPIRFNFIVSILFSFYGFYYQLVCLPVIVNADISSLSVVIFFQFVLMRLPLSLSRRIVFFDAT